MRRRRFVQLAALAAAAAVPLARLPLARLPLRLVPARFRRAPPAPRYPGPVRALDPRALSRPARWAG